MDASPPQLPPLHEIVTDPLLQTHQRYAKSAFILRSLLLLLFLPLLLIYRLRPSSYYYYYYHHHHNEHEHDHDIPHLLLLATALLCELWFSLQAHLSVFPRLRVIQRLVHPSRLLLDTAHAHSHSHSHAHAHAHANGQLLDELPPVDVFVTTADPLKEPPLVTLNTFLSALALHYSPRRLSCYVSDDGGSLLNLWAIKLAAAFARHWVPFCRRFPSSITPRAPGTYFAKHNHVPDTHIAISSSDATDFAAEWTTMKAKYKELERRVTSMTQRYGDDRSKAEALKQMLADVMMDSPGNGEGGYVARLKRSVLSESSWAAVDYDSRQHHAYCEVLIDKSEAEEEEGLPCLVYMSREKSLQRKHHYKAGNMNALVFYLALSQ